MLEQGILREIDIYVEKHLDRINRFACFLLADIGARNAEAEWADNTNNTRQPSFGQVLSRLMEAKNFKKEDVYAKARLDEASFDREISSPPYRPHKESVLALAVALELDKNETERLLTAAGYSLLESEKFDLVIQFCLENKIHNMDDVNQALVYCGLKPLPE